MMDYTFQYQMKARDLWQLMLYQLYGSLAGMCNLVFTAAMLALAVSKRGESSEAWYFMIIMGCLWFPVIHPVLIYQKAKRQLSAMVKDIELSFGHGGIQVKQEGECLNLRWPEVKSISKRPTLLIILIGGGRGYLLPNRVLGKQKQAFYTYARLLIETQ